MQEYKDWSGNLASNPTPTVHNVHIGDIIKIKINDEDHIGRTSKYGQYEVIGIYPRIVLARDKKTGFRRSFSYGDLLTMGLENQGPEIDELRKYNKKDQQKENASIKRSSFNPDYDPEKYRKKRKKKNEDSGEEN